MRPATGWIANLTSMPLRLEHLGQLAHRVLGLRDGHAVAGHDDDLARVGHLDAASAALVERTVRSTPSSPRRRRPSTTPPKPPATIAGIERFMACGHEVA